MMRFIFNLMMLHLSHGMVVRIITHPDLYIGIWNPDFKSAWIGLNHTFNSIQLKYTVQLYNDKSDEYSSKTQSVTIDSIHEDIQFDMMFTRLYTIVLWFSDETTSINAIVMTYINPSYNRLMGPEFYSSTSQITPIEMTWPSRKPSRHILIDFKEDNNRFEYAYIFIIFFGLIVITLGIFIAVYAHDKWRRKMAIHEPILISSA